MDPFASLVEVYSVPVDAEADPESRGRLPPQEANRLSKFMVDIMELESDDDSDDERSVSDVYEDCSDGFDSDYWLDSELFSDSDVESDSESDIDVPDVLLSATLMNVQSYDKNRRPEVDHKDAPRVDIPWVYFGNHYFTHLTSFSIAHFLSMVLHLTLLDNLLIDPATRTPFSKGLGLFVILCRFRNMNWQVMSHVLFTSRPRLLAIYGHTLDLLSLHYRVVVRVIDYVRVDPLLAAWSAVAHATCGSAVDNLYVADGKPWPWSVPGVGKAARKFAERLGIEASRIQRAFYNGYYGVHGARIQHLVEVSGILYSYCCSIRNHDAVLLRKSKIDSMLDCMYVNNDPNRPVRVMTDKGYARSEHWNPAFSAAQLAAAAYNPTRLLALEENNAANYGPRAAVEHSFAYVFTMFPFFDQKRKFRLFEGGKENYGRLMETYDMAVFFANIKTCLTGGNIITGKFGVDPPSLEEYLHSVHSGTYVNVNFD